MCSLILYQLKKQVFSQMDSGNANSNVTAIAQAKLKTCPDGKLKPEKSKTKRVFISSSYFLFHELFLLCYALERTPFFSHNTFIKRETKNPNPTTVIQSSHKK